MVGKFSNIEDPHSDGVDVCFKLCYLSRKQRCLVCTCLWLPIASLVILFCGILVNTALVKERFVHQPFSDEAPNLINPSPELKLKWAKNLGDAIKIQTVSFNETAISRDELLEMQTYLEAAYPLVHSSDFVTRMIVNDLSILYRVEGEIPTKNPYMLCAHLDVVPKGGDNWSHDPFLGDIITDENVDYIFGRGTIDDKQSVTGILEALEHILSQGKRPKRTFYIAFGHDEEISGHEGAAFIAKTLEKLFADNDEKLAFILDEGMCVVQDVFTGVDDPVINVGVVEKGWAVVKLTVNGVQGHASKPPKETAIGILAHAIAKLEDNPSPARFGDSVEYDTMSYVAPYANFLYRMVLGNMWIFSSSVSKIMSEDPTTDAIQRTTTAVTIVNGGLKVNVVPDQATAFINHRIHPSETPSDIFQHDIDTINDDRVIVEMIDSFPPSIIADYSNDAIPFRIVVNSALEVYPDGKVSPGVMMANTDTRHYINLTDTIFRFSPTKLFPSDLDRFHGIDERISVDNYAQVVEFFYRLISNADYDIVEKSDIEVISAYEGSGLGESVSGENPELAIVDEVVDDSFEGSTEL